jgi:hypothetical protein
MSNENTKTCYERLIVEHELTNGLIGYDTVYLAYDCSFQYLVRGLDYEKEKDMKAGVIEFVDDDVTGTRTTTSFRIDRDINNVMTFSSNPTEEERRGFERIAMVAKIFAQIIRDNTPKSARQTIALQHVVDARMSANAAIATHGEGFEY